MRMHASTRTYRHASPLYVCRRTESTNTHFLAHLAPPPSYTRSHTHTRQISPSSRVLIIDQRTSNGTHGALLHSVQYTYLTPTHHHVAPLHPLPIPHLPSEWRR